MTPQKPVADVAQALVLAASPLLGTFGEPRTGGRFHSNLCATPSAFERSCFPRRHLTTAAIYQDFSHV
jgi:hypothetical protein